MTSSFTVEIIYAVGVGYVVAFILLECDVFSVL
jgi:hypothetical protein